MVVFVESGLLFPVLPGDSLLFTAGMLAAGTAAQDEAANANFALWQLLVFVPIAAVAGGQVGYWVGRGIGTSLFKAQRALPQKRYLDEAHEFFERHGPLTIILARFVPIVRTFTPCRGRRAHALPAVPRLRHRRRHPVGGGRDAARATSWAMCRSSSTTSSS